MTYTDAILYMFAACLIALGLVIGIDQYQPHTTCVGGVCVTMNKAQAMNAARGLCDWAQETHGDYTPEPGSVCADLGY